MPEQTEEKTQGLLISEPGLSEVVNFDSLWSKASLISNNNTKLQIQSVKNI